LTLALALKYEQLAQLRLTGQRVQTPIVSLVKYPPGQKNQHIFSKKYFNVLAGSQDKQF